ncbi:MAG: aminotransferase class I/II-fold pyridoxal phosphate-dependent enzyme [Acidobacteria bacterium]|nr:aminotransferase class I/II-fold pyridoxal phosphate-dependent enzyme [Acidobacteriota bacterium]
MSELPPNQQSSTVAAQAGGWVDPPTGGLVPPIHTAVQYQRTPEGKATAGRIYTRDQNPTYEPPERLLATLEGGRAAMLFSSGVSAAISAFETLEIGAHVVAPVEMYWMLRRWLEMQHERKRFELELVPNGDLDALRAALRPGETRIVWAETPANPGGVITDLRAAADIAHEAGARFAVDNTVPTPVLTRPIEHGADLVMHSATKQLNGHSDVLAGALVTSEEDDFWRACRRERAFRGAVIGPFESWLLLRGMRTVVLRVTQSARSAQQIAEHFVRHPAVAEVRYPGLPDFPGHAIAARQMDGGFGSVVSMRMAGGAPAAARVVRLFRLFHNATSLGGVESLAEQRRMSEGPGSPVPDDLVRFSVGIEAAEDLIADIEQAFDRLSA